MNQLDEVGQVIKFIIRKSPLSIYGFLSAIALAYKELANEHGVKDYAKASSFFMEMRNVWEERLQKEKKDELEKRKGKGCNTSKVEKAENG